MASPIHEVSKPGGDAAAGGSAETRPARCTLSAPVGAEGGGVVLVCAPAGSGKTMLLRSGSRRPTTGPGALGVGERGEQDAERFWLTVIDALAGAVSVVQPVARRRRSAAGASSISSWRTLPALRSGRRS